VNPRLLLPAAAVAVVGLACADRPDGPAAPAGPEFRRQARGQVCDFTVVNRAATKYFSQPTLNQARELIRQMQDAGQQTETARERGFDVMALIENQLLLGGGSLGSPATGSDLVKGLILCMFDPESGPEHFPANFTSLSFAVSLDPVQAGAFGVRGGANDNEGAVLARGDVPRSGVGPLSSSSWSAILSERILIYGFPVSLVAYDWSSVRPGAAGRPGAPGTLFASPGVVVGLCEVGSNLLVRETSVGLLVYEDAHFLTDPSCSAGTSSIGWSGAGLFAAMQPIARFAAALVTPRPLFAAVNPGGVGGLAGGLRSEFSTEAITVSDAAFGAQPHDAVVNASIGMIWVRATAGGLAVPNASITLIAVDNNGAPEPGISCPALGGPCVATTDGDGIADFGEPTLNKTGAYRLEAQGSVNDRDIPVSVARSDKFNIRP
jgi:hypothetical protein